MLLYGSSNFPYINTEAITIATVSKFTTGPLSCLPCPDSPQPCPSLTQIHVHL